MLSLASSGLLFAATVSGRRRRQKVPKGLWMRFACLASKQEAGEPHTHTHAESVCDVTFFSTCHDAASSIHNKNWIS